MTELSVRQAREADHEAITAFTDNTWPDRGIGDYIPDVFPEWVASDGPTQRTFVLEAEGEVAGLCQGVLLSEHDAWAQGMRVAPAARGEGASKVLNDAVFDWAAEQGATICRNMVFSWNVAGLGASRNVGYDPGAEFRWAHPQPDPGPAPTPDAGLHTVENAAAAWTCWQRSDAREALGGLALDFEESWALAELTHERLARAAADTRVLAVQGEGASSGTRAFAYRTRDYERESDDATTERWAEYGAASWTDLPAARTLFAAIRRDAASLGVDRTRVLIPETVRHVSDAAAAGVEVSEHPDFVMEADLTTRS
jgi:GNAT superfamily N-acetyltransferase